MIRYWRMMVTKVFLLALLLGCTVTEPPRTDGEYVMTSPAPVFEGHLSSGSGWAGIYRVENKEVICYIYAGSRRGGLACRWKGLSEWKGLK